ncbi:MEDS domain-containing protein [Candidatus Nitrosocosmicus sp. FF01]|jgi:hypothetical protein|uniref:MEDS domain-containing protein n=1 Tax=Candidatus Nitrosocosmicus sp. FF01 TaxID=3397670 RepID=UPI0039E88AE1
MNPRDAAETISQTAFGLHCLLIYRDLVTLREFYSSYFQRQINQNGTIQVMPFYETENSVREVLSKNGKTSIDILKQVGASLIIVDALRGYFDHGNVESIWKNIKEIVQNAEEVGKKEISILGDAGAFFYKHQIQSLLDYESILPLNFDINLKGICMYHQKDFNKMSKDFQEKILKRHSMAIMI